MNILIIHVGASFRYGERFNLLIGTEQSFEGQKNASESHVRFSEFLRDRWNITSDFLIDTYTTQYDANLTSWYPQGSRFFLNEPFKSYDWLLNDAVLNANNVSAYDAVLFIRIDLVLLPGLSEAFRPFEKLTFPFLQGNMWKHPDNGNPMVGDLIVYVPKTMFTIFNHTCLEWFPNQTIYIQHWSYPYYSANKIGFWVEEYHSSSSKDDWNPLYYIVNRDRSFNIGYTGDTFEGFDGSWDDDMTFPKLDINYCPPLKQVTSDSRAYEVACTPINSALLFALSVFLLL